MTKGFYEIAARRGRERLGRAGRARGAGRLLSGGAGVSVHEAAAARQPVAIRLGGRASSRVGPERAVLERLAQRTTLPGTDHGWAPVPAVVRLAREEVARAPHVRCSWRAHVAVLWHDGEFHRDVRQFGFTVYMSQGRSRELTCAAFFFAVLIFCQGHSLEQKSEERAEFLSPQAATHIVGRVVASTASLIRAAEHEEQHSSRYHAGEEGRKKTRLSILVRILREKPRGASQSKFSGENSP